MILTLEFAAIDNSFVFWPLAVLAVRLVGLAKNGLAGSGVLAVTVMAIIFKPKESAGVLLPMLIAADLFAILYYRRHGEWRFLREALPSALVGVLLGFALMKLVTIPQWLFQRIVGLIVLTMLLMGEFMEWRRRSGKQEAPRSKTAMATVGVVGGATSMMANAAGPIFNLYLLSLRLEKQRFVGTAAWLFFILNLSKTPFSGGLGLINAPSLLFDLAMLPAVLLGAVLGIAYVKRIPQKRFDAVVKILTALATLKLLLG